MATKHDEDLATAFVNPLVVWARQRVGQVPLERCHLDVMPLIPQSLALVVLLASSSALAAPSTKEACAAANEGAQHLMRAHKPLEAREKLLICVAEGCPAVVREDCSQRLDAVSKEAGSVVFEVKDMAGNDVRAVQISIDGRPFTAGVVGIAIEVNPGEHAFAFEAPGLPKTQRELVIPEGVKLRQEVVVLGATEAPRWAASPAPAGAPGRASGPPNLAWMAFGVGGAGLMLGATAGLAAGGKHSTLEGECDNTTSTCAPQYASDLDAFHSWRTASTIGYVVGALGVAGGVTLWFLTPKAPTSTTGGVWIGPATAGIGGRF